MTGPQVVPSATTMLRTQSAPRRGMPVLLRRLMPLIVVAVVLVLTYVWVSSLDLDSIEQRTLNADYITARIGEHLVLSIIASVLVAVLAIPAGIAVSRS